MNAVERESIVATALAEVSARAKELIAAGCAPEVVIGGVREAAEIVVEQRVEDALRLAQPEAVLDAYVDHAGGSMDAVRERDAYRAATNTAGRAESLERLIRIANESAMRRHRERLGRTLTAFGIAYGAMKRMARSRTPRSRRTPATRGYGGSGEDPDGEPPTVGALVGVV